MAGRTRKPPGEKHLPYSVYLPPPLKDQLAAIADAKGVPMARLIVQMVELGLEAAQEEDRDAGSRV